MKGENMKKGTIGICSLILAILAIVGIKTIYFSQEKGMIESNSESHLTYENILNLENKDSNTSITQNEETISGIFNAYEQKANQKLQTMTLDEKISQLFLVRFPNSNAKEILKQYQFGGYIFFAKDFKDKTKQQVIDTMKELQKVANIPILTAVDEEGGIVVLSLIHI